MKHVPLFILFILCLTSMNHVSAKKEKVVRNDVYVSFSVPLI
jgi:hypothetical protein